MFIIKDSELSYYAGRHHKYADMISFCASLQGALMFDTSEAAQKIADHFNKRGYDMEVVEIAPARGEVWKEVRCVPKT